MLRRNSRVAGPMLAMTLTKVPITNPQIPPPKSMSVVQTHISPALYGVAGRSP